MPAPVRTRTQQLEALVEANRIRVVRAEAKERIARGRQEWTALLDDPDFQTMRALELIRALPKIGRVKSAALLNAAHVPLTRSVGALTLRQRSDLRDIVPVHAPYPRRPSA